MDQPCAPHIGRLIREGGRSFSFEFFPPKDEAGEAQLWQAIRDLEPYHPTFVSVTYGAGGSTRDTTVDIIGRIARETSMVPMGHLTCVGHTREELESILAAFADAGVHNVLAQRGGVAAQRGQPDRLLVHEVVEDGLDPLPEEGAVEGVRSHGPSVVTGPRGVDSAGLPDPGT